MRSEGGDDAVDDVSAAPVPGADPAVVGPYLARVLGNEAWTRCTVRVIPGGMSNLTYWVSSSAGDVILRRPPLGHVLPSAHDMAREFRVISALADTQVPVPKTLDLCADPDILGQPFYVMEAVDGIVVRPGTLDEVLPRESDRTRVSRQLVDVLADLHAIDPDDIGLSGFGKAEGYLARQLRRWGASGRQPGSRVPASWMTCAPGLRAKCLTGRVPPSFTATIG